MNMSAVLYYLNLVVLFLFVLWRLLQLIMMCGRDSIEESQNLFRLKQLLAAALPD